MESDQWKTTVKTDGRKKRKRYLSEQNKYEKRGNTQGGNLLSFFA